MTLNELLHSCGAAGNFRLQVFLTAKTADILTTQHKHNLERRQLNGIRLRAGPIDSKGALSVRTACLLCYRVQHI